MLLLIFYGPAIPSSRRVPSNSHINWSLSKSGPFSTPPPLQFDENAVRERRELRVYTTEALQNAFTRVARLPYLLTTVRQTKVALIANVGAKVGPHAMRSFLVTQHGVPRREQHMRCAAQRCGVVNSKATMESR